MKFQEFLPDHSLRQYVYHYAILSNDVKTGEEIAEQTPPNLYKGLFFYYRKKSPVTIVNSVFDNDLPRSFLAAHCSRSQKWMYSDPFSVFGIMFKPGKLRYFLRFSLLEFIDRPIALSDIGDKGLLELEERIFESESLAERINAANDFLSNRLRVINRQPDLVDWALSQLFASPGKHIKDLPLEIRISDRHFRRIFEREMGVGPKAWQKQARFTQALHMIQSPFFTNLSKVAHACGYYEQSQFISDFKGFMLCTPGEFIRKSFPIAKLVGWREEVVDGREFEM
ncbi:MAG: helix-turn-helix transcriptional regulator [Saprospiraceae bacterium]|nr:helix-turn-helix transcriptional regulator [Saprospiraceae bacterium]